MEESSKARRFRQIILPHLDAAYNLARWLMGNQHDAEDAAQDACVRALTFFEGFRGEDGRGWLLAIVRNTCYTYLRRRDKPELTALHEPAHASRAPDPEQVQLQSAEARTIRTALEQLPAEFREILLLRELEGLSYKQLARIMEIPIGTVMSRLARARKRLLEILKETGVSGVVA